MLQAPPSSSHSLDRRTMLLGATATLGGLLVPSQQSLAAGTGRKPYSVIVQTHEGALRGLRSAKLDVFRGVRYAAAPTGHRRFRAPQPLAPWKGIRDAVRLGAPCPQDNFDLPPWQDPMPASEDCLFLNIFAPREAGPHPVMVFFHGGAFAYGSGGAPMYDGAALAERGKVVVVTINHRLNIFGFLHLAEIDPAFRESANAGQQDLICALHWIRRNIAGFGGNPGNITIFGESGGGAKVTLLLGTPLAKGLYHRAIVQSGSIPELRPADAGTQEALAVLQELGIARDRVDLLSSLPAERIQAAYRKITAQAGFGGWTRLPFSPVTEPFVLPFQPNSREALSQSRNVPLLAGSNDAEAVFFVLGADGTLPAAASDADLVPYLTAPPHPLTPSDAAGMVAAWRQSRPAATPQDILIAIRSAQLFGIDCERQAQAKAEFPGAPAYVYRFGWADPCFGGHWSMHGGELAFLFDKLDVDLLWDRKGLPARRAAADPDNRRSALRDAIIESWTSFARTGAPSAASLPAWPAYDRTNRKAMYLAAHSKVVDHPLGAELGPRFLG